MTLGLMLLASMLFTPTVAEAVFSGTASRVMTVTTAKLAAPDAVQTVSTASCEKAGGDSKLTITVGSLAEVPGANLHELTVFNPAGEPIETVVLDAGGYVYPKTDQWKTMIGTWTYEIHGSYAVPGSTNVWEGPPLSRTVICPDRAGKGG
ncbi:hypothetical protein [Arthrobacter monumenti]